MTKARMKRPRKCPICGDKIDQPKTGRPKQYCKPACRQRAYEKRRARSRAPQRLLARDMSDRFMLRGDAEQEADRAALRVLLKLAIRWGFVPPGMNVEEFRAELEQELEAADLEAQYRLPAKRRPDPKRGA
jgi:hypothetical protein